MPLARNETPRKMPLARNETPRKMPLARNKTPRKMPLARNKTPRKMPGTLCVWTPICEGDTTISCKGNMNQKSQRNMTFHSL